MFGGRGDGAARRREIEPAIAESEGSANVAIAAAGSAFAWLIALGPLEAREWVIPLGPLRLTFTELLAAFAAVVAAGAVAYAARRDRDFAGRLRERLESPVAIALASWAALHVLSATWAGEGALTALKFGLRVAGGVTLALLALALGAEARFLRRVRFGLAIGVGILTVVGVAERLGGQALEPMLSLFRDEPTWMLGEQRLSTVFYHANTMAAWLELVLPWLLVEAVVAPTLPRRLLRGVLLTAALIILSLTYSRAGLLAGLVACVALIYAARRRDAPRLARVAMLAAAALAASYLANPDMRARLGLEERRYSASYRIDGDCVGEPGSLVRVPVRVRNEGEWPLSNRQAPGELAHVIWPDEGRPPARDFRYQPMPALQPGEEATLTVAIELPDEPGGVDVVVDIRRKNVIWLSAVGVEPGRIHCLAVDPDATVAADDDGDQLPETLRMTGRPLELERRHYWLAALRLFDERPLLGQGADQFRHRYRRYVPARGWDKRARSHSIVMETAANLGLAGLLVLGVLAGCLGVLLWAGLHRRRAGLYQLAAATGVAAFLLHGLVDYFLGYTQIVVVFWPLLGVATSLALAQRSRLRSLAEATPDPALDTPGDT